MTKLSPVGDENHKTVLHYSLKMLYDIIAKISELTNAERNVEKYVSLHNFEPHYMFLSWLRTCMTIKGSNVLRMNLLWNSNWCF